MFSTSPSNTPGRVASPGFPQSPPQKPSTLDYSAFTSLQQSLSSSRPNSNTYTSPPPQFSLPQQQTASRHTPTTSVDDDFGTFSSAVSASSANVIQLTNSRNILITLAPSKEAGNVTLTTKFTNKLPVQIDEITFQMAVPKVPLPFSLSLLVGVNLLSRP